MTRTFAAAALALSLSLPAWAEDPGKAAAPKPAPEMQARKGAPKKAHHSKADEDARHCLKLGTNEAIIRCAEAYR